MLRIKELLSVVIILLSGCQHVSRDPSSDVLTKMDPISLARLDAETAYGKELIARTAYYIGPMGTVGHFTGNKMNCQNCHLDAATRKFGNHLLVTHATYPQYRAREDRILTLAERINNCIERPMNGKALSENSREMRALLSYIQWIGRNIPLERKKDRLMPLTFPNQAANSENGRKVYEQYCLRCHGGNGAGVMNYDNISFLYPPLWGENSFSKGSSMHRISKMAAFIKSNMPFGEVTDNPVLTDKEALDVAAFINDDRIHSRPGFLTKNDYPKITQKPIDYPYGPYSDPFSELEHRLGPFDPIIEYRTKNGLFINY